jgi:hypothetical protein
LKTVSALRLLVGLAIGSCHFASAATVTNIASTITNAGNCTSIDSCAENYSITGQGGVTQAETVPPQAAFGFTDSFNQGSNISTGSNLGASATCGPLGCSAWNFQDNIVFSLTNSAEVQAQASATLNNVTDLQARIIELNGLNVFTNSNANAQTLLGGPGVVTVVDGWQNFANPILGVDSTGTMPIAVGAGDYILQIRGEAASGSAYSGTITFTPVPLPATFWLLLGSLGGLGAMIRGRTLAAKA